jgi:hypothetical protein
VLQRIGARIGFVSEVNGGVLAVGVYSSSYCNYIGVCVADHELQLRCGRSPISFERSAAPSEITLRKVTDPPRLQSSPIDIAVTRANLPPSLSRSRSFA